MGAFQLHKRPNKILLRHHENYYCQWQDAAFLLQMILRIFKQVETVSLVTNYVRFGIHPFSEPLIILTKNDRSWGSFIGHDFFFPQ